MTNSQFFLGLPIEFKELCLVYPPKVKEILANKKFGLYAKVLTISQEEIEDEWVKNSYDSNNLLTPFEYILNCAFNNEDFKNILIDAFRFFIHEPVLFLFERKEIIIGKIQEIKKTEEMRIMHEEDFFDFQNLVRQAIGQKILQAPNPDENPKIKAMKAKARYRDKIKAKKNSLDIVTLLASICCMGFGLNPLNIGELSYASVNLLISTYQEKEKYERDIDSLLAGADSKKVHPVYWIRNLEE